MGLSRGPRATQAGQHGRNRLTSLAAWFYSWCDHIPAVHLLSSSVTSEDQFHLLTKGENDVCGKD